jgi:hypothetical protein
MSGKWDALLKGCERYCVFATCLRLARNPRELLRFPCKLERT